MGHVGYTWAEDEGVWAGMVGGDWKGEEEVKEVKEENPSPPPPRQKHHPPNHQPPKLVARKSRLCFLSRMTQQTEPSPHQKRTPPPPQAPPPAATKATPAPQDNPPPLWCRSCRRPHCRHQGPRPVLTGLSVFASPRPSTLRQWICTQWQGNRNGWVGTLTAWAPQ